MSSDTKFVYMGCDLETTGTLSKSEIIQIGLYIDDDHKYVSDIGHRGAFHWEAKAFEVNGFDLKRVYNGKPMYNVDAELDEFITKVKQDFNCQSEHILPVGFNVGSFDIPFIRRDLKLFFSGLGYRSIDLNALLVASSNSVDNFNARKIALKEQAKQLITVDGKEHDALYDAELAIRCFNCLTGN